MKFAALVTIVLTGSTTAFVTPRIAPRASLVKASSSPLFRNPSFLLSSTDGDTPSSASDDSSSSSSTAVLGEIMVISDDDMAEAKLAISKNWGFILTTGVADLLAGTATLLAPIYATAIAQITQVAALFVIGFINILGVFYVEQGLKARSLLIGLGQVTLGTFIGNNPVESRYMATLLLLSLGFADGLYRLILAVQNSDLPERGWTIFGGLASMAVSCLVAANLEIASLFTLGAVMGGMFISAGWTRIFVALGGREDANAIIDPSSASSSIASWK